MTNADAWGGIDGVTGTGSDIQPFLPPTSASCFSLDDNGGGNDELGWWNIGNKFHETYKDSADTLQNGAHGMPTWELVVICVSCGLVVCIVSLCLLACCFKPLLDFCWNLIRCPFECLLVSGRWFCGWFSSSSRTVDGRGAEGRQKETEVTMY
eukprot:GHVQ01004449.1.p1 GENE.GHVQ01004449.1~~GHVQ01004449.1.p1  ORF type:complete len:153 (+),score=14.50 GHVQ01004449.1:66-524(+)